MTDNEDSLSAGNATQISLTEQEIKEELRRLFLGGDDWSKEACMGYFLKACQKAKLDIKTTQNLAVILYRLFDELSVEEAKNIYYHDCHSILSGNE